MSLCPTAQSINFGEGIHRCLPNYGSRLKIGLIIPSVNTIVEPQMHAMVPAGVTTHVTRLALRGSGFDALKAMADDVEAAARLVADAGVDVIAFHCTAASTLSVEIMESIAARIHDATKLPAFTTGHAIREALQQLSAQKVVFVSPYMDETHARELNFLQECGFSIVNDGCMRVGPVALYAAKPPKELYEFAVAHRHEDAEAYLFGCTAIRSNDVITELETTLSRPVVTSNQALLWYALRKLGVKDLIPGYGRLLECN